MPKFIAATEAFIKSIPSRLWALVPKAKTDLEKALGPINEAAQALHKVRLNASVQEQKLRAEITALTARADAVAAKALMAQNAANNLTNLTGQK